jgi:hypothetical protein
MLEIDNHVIQAAGGQHAGADGAGKHGPGPEYHIAAPEAVAEHIGIHQASQAHPAAGSPGPPAPANLRMRQTTQRV